MWNIDWFEERFLLRKAQESKGKNASDEGMPRGTSTLVFPDWPLGVWIHIKFLIISCCSGNTLAGSKLDSSWRGPGFESQ